MLTGLDAIDWSTLQDAYGSATEVPGRLRALLSDDEAVRSEALSELFGSVSHQGTIYSVSAHVIPFLVELLATPQVKDKPSIIALLASIAGGRGYYEVHDAIIQKLAKRPVDLSAKRSEEMSAVAAVRRAASPHIPGLLPHLAHPESEVRLTVAQALPFYPEHGALSKAALEKARRCESDPEVLEVFDEAFAALPQTA
jgi:HEAT repeat protein